MSARAPALASAALLCALGTLACAPTTSSTGAPSPTTGERSADEPQDAPADVGASLESLAERALELGPGLSQAVRSGVAATPEARCLPLHPAARLGRVQVLSGPEGVDPDSARERSTSDVPVYLQARIELDLDGERVVLEPADRAALPCGLTLEWSKLEATVDWHTNKDDEGHTEFTPMPYAATPFASAPRVLADVHPTLHADPFPEVETGLGVMRYQLSASWRGETAHSPGLDDRATAGTFDTSVAAVSYRPDTGTWVDYTFELFNAPYVWGSTRGQADAQAAADCADLAVYGLRRAGHDIEYTWSYGMRHVTRERAEVTSIDAEGRFRTDDGELLSVGTDARVGDVLLFRRHIAVLWADDGDGILDVDDQIIQTNWRHPEVVSFADMRYDHTWFEVRWVPE